MMIANDDMDAVRAYVSAAAPLLKLDLHDEFQVHVSTALAELLVAANSLQGVCEVGEEPMRHDEKIHDR
jgi:hypothetical protein